MNNSDGSISSEHRTVCEACDNIKMCKLYVLQSGYIAWVCKECRNGEDLNGHKLK